ncbi:hypothetical protein CR513_50548, partial [Mucuna pruriens]
MASSNFNMEDLSPKSKMMMEYMKKLKEKIEKLSGGLESMRIDSHNVRLIELSFEGHALIFWNEISLQYRGMRRASIESWEELKKRRETILYLCISMYHGSRLVDEYFKGMEVTMIRAQNIKSQEDKMARFFSNGLIETFKTLWSYIIILLFLCLFTKLLKLNPNLRGMEKNPYPSTSSNWRGEDQNILTRDKKS